MKFLSIVRQANPTNTQLIEDYEKVLGISLPIELKSFFLTINPIDIEERVIKKGRSYYYMDRFFPFDEYDELSFQSTNDNLREFFENKYLTFACDAGGWQFVISIQKSNYGKVYFCRMDEELEDALTLLANDFEDFINNLTIDSNS